MLIVLGSIYVTYFIRGILLTIVLVHGLLTIIKLWIEGNRPKKNFYFITFLILHLLWGVIFCIQKEIINDGLALLTSLELLIFAFSLKREDHKKVLSAASIMTVIVALAISISSFILVAISFNFPEIYNIEFFQNKLVIGHRLYGIAGHPNYTGPFVAIGIIASIINYILKKNRASAVLCYISTAINGAALLSTGSRTSIVYVAIFIVLILISSIYSLRSLKETYTKLKTPINALALIIIVFIISIIVYSILSEQLITALFKQAFEYIKMNIIRPDSLSTATGRSKIFQDMFNLAIDNPIFGVGRQSIWSYGYPHTHNAFLQCIVRSGFICGLLFILLWLYPVYASTQLTILKKKEMDYPIFFAVIISSIIINLFEPYLFFETAPYFVIPYLCAFFSVSQFKEWSKNGY